VEGVEIEMRIVDTSVGPLNYKDEIGIKLTTRGLLELSFYSDCGRDCGDTANEVSLTKKQVSVLIAELMYQLTEMK
jgi:hypothetical protein